MEYEFDQDGNLISAIHPRYLFKYKAINEGLFSMIKENYLWFSNISDFNDPFECYTQIDNNVSDDEFLQYLGFITDNVMPKSVLQQLQKLVESPHDFITENWGDIKSMMTDDLMTRQMHKQMEHIGICCFSEEKSSVLMWAHYANNFQGVCLVYDFVELVQSAPFVPLKVRYLEDIPKFNYIRHRLKKLHGSPDGRLGETDTELDKIMFGTKKLEWTYEKEYRLMSYSQGKVPIRPTSLKGIIFGSRTTEKQKLEIQELVRKSHSKIEFATISTDLNRKMISSEKFDNEKITRNDVIIFNLYETIKKFHGPY
jgi:hypothetical protein